MEDKSPAYKREAEINTQGRMRRSKTQEIEQKTLGNRGGTQQQGRQNRSQTQAKIQRQKPSEKNKGRNPENKAINPETEQFTAPDSNKRNQPRKTEQETQKNRENKTQ
uniref:Uncharacterized protein n=1 Tax=Populus davidiana TaxID=266767 RepID=A0A6M2E663_9ROSI